MPIDRVGQFFVIFIADQVRDQAGQVGHMLDFDQFSGPAFKVIEEKRETSGEQGEVIEVHG